MPVIVVTSRDNVKTHVLEEGKPLFLGRSTDCDVVLPSSSVSRRHAVILYRDGVCGVKDLGSFNGTVLNDRVILEPCQLKDTDVLRISSYVIRLYIKNPALTNIEETSADFSPADLSVNGVGVSGKTKTPNAPSRPRKPRIDSLILGNSNLPLPRAMHHQYELFRNMGELESAGPPSHNTQTSFPRRDTARFVRIVGDAEGKKREPEEAGEMDKAGADTPIRTPEQETAEGTAADLSEFEESPLSPLNAINQFKESGPTPFLATAESFVMTDDDVGLSGAAAELIIPMGAESPDDLTVYSPEAEAIIPLLDDSLFISTLKENTADGIDGEGGNDGERDIFENVSVSPDTGEFTLLPSLNERGDLFDPDDYQIAALSPGTREGGLASTPRDGGEADAGLIDPLYVVQGSMTDEELTERLFGAESETDADNSGNLAADGDSGAEGVRVRSDLKGKSILQGIAGITISPTLMEAINARLHLYSLLNELVEERKRFRKQNPALSEEIDEELDRQDGELERLPTTGEVERLIQDLRERKSHLELAIRQAKEAGVAGPQNPTSQMQFAEKMAMMQWRLIRDSNRQALPPIFREAYPLIENEPLVKELKAAGISHGRLAGGAMYLLCLESLSAIATRKRFRIAKRLGSLYNFRMEADGLIGKIGEVGKMAGTIAKLGQLKREEERLRHGELVNAARVDLARREAAFMERILAIEFRQVYKKVALRYVPLYASMPLSIRAFLRHGVIGYSPWWMTRGVRDFIIRDCSVNVIPELSRSTRITNVLYADEYLYAVSLMECTPSPDEDLANAPPTSFENKTDRAFRRLVNAKYYNELMGEVVRLQEATGQYLFKEAFNLHGCIEAIKTNGVTRDTLMFDQQARLDHLHRWKRRIGNNILRINNELIPSLLNVIEDAERLFRTEDLRVPDPETLIGREVDALFRIARHLEAGAGRFVPMAVRDYYRDLRGKVNDRSTVRRVLSGMEELDPGIFIRTVIQSRHKHYRVNLRMSPTVLIFPAVGGACVCSMGRKGMEGGHLVVPSCFGEAGMRERGFMHMLADFRWDTSLAMAGHETLKTETLSWVFGQLRRQMKIGSEAAVEKRLIYPELGDRENWRLAYECYLPDAYTGGRGLFQRNPELYEALIGVYIEPVEGAKILRRAWSHRKEG